MRDARRLSIQNPDCSLRSMLLESAHSKLNGRRIVGIRGDWLKSCPLCRADESRLTTTRSDVSDSYEVQCPICGRYGITFEANVEIQAAAHLGPLISGWTRERTIRNHPEPFLCSSTFERKPEDEGKFRISEILGVYVPKTPAEVLNRALLNVVVGVQPGRPFNIMPDSRALFFSGSTEEMLFYLKAMAERHWLEIPKVGVPCTAVVTIEGWNHAADLERARPSSTQAFVAMSFASDLDSAWEVGLSKGIADAGFSPFRTDKREHNEKICDLIIVELRRSRFLVADVTKHRQGVYFEAGYAMGLGLPVIWTCGVPDKDNCHFDTRQYNHIFWDSPENLRIALGRRIQATII